MSAKLRRRAQCGQVSPPRGQVRRGGLVLKVGEVRKIKRRAPASALDLRKLLNCYSK